MVLSLWLMPKSEYKQSLLKIIYKLKNEAIMQAAIRAMVEEIRE